MSAILLDDGKGGWMPAQLMYEHLERLGLLGRIIPETMPLIVPSTPSAALDQLVIHGYLESTRAMPPFGVRNPDSGRTWFRFGPKLRSELERVLGEAASNPVLQEAVARLGGLKL